MMEAQLPFLPLMIAIAGASGSGKSTLASELARVLSGLHFPLDTYYRDLGDLPLEQRKRVNFDDPAMIDTPLLTRHIAALAAGLAIDRPLYEFANYTCIPGASERIEPGPVVVVEGLFSLYFRELRPYYQFSVFVDTPDDICFARRMKRDIDERGRDPESIRRQYDATVRPCGLAFVRPLVDFADLVLDGTEALDFKIEQIIGILKRRGLLSRSDLSA